MHNLTNALVEIDEQKGGHRNKQQRQYHQEQGETRTGGEREEDGEEEEEEEEESFSQRYARAGLGSSKKREFFVTNITDTQTGRGVRTAIEANVAARNTLRNNNPTSSTSFRQGARGIHSRFFTHNANEQDAFTAFENATRERENDVQKERIQNAISLKNEVSSCLDAFVANRHLNQQTQNQNSKLEEGKSSSSSSSSLTAKRRNREGGEEGKEEDRGREQQTDNKKKKKKSLLEEILEE